MKLTADRGPAEVWDAQAGEALIKELWALRKSMLERQAKLEPWLRDVEPAHRASAINLTYFLAMRGMDLRGLQDRLSFAQSAVDVRALRQRLPALQWRRASPSTFTTPM